MLKYYFLSIAFLKTKNESDNSPFNKKVTL